MRNYMRNVVFGLPFNNCVLREYGTFTSDITREIPIELVVKYCKGIGYCCNGDEILLNQLIEMSKKYKNVLKISVDITMGVERFERSDLPNSWLSNSIHSYIIYSTIPFEGDIMKSKCFIIENYEAIRLINISNLSETSGQELFWTVNSEGIVLSYTERENDDDDDDDDDESEDDL